MEFKGIVFLYWDCLNFRVEFFTMNGIDAMFESSC